MHINFELNLWLLLFRLGPTLSYDIDADVKGGKVAKIHICTLSGCRGLSLREFNVVMPM